MNVSEIFEEEENMMYDDIGFVDEAENSMELDDVDKEMLHAALESEHVSTDLVWKEVYSPSRPQNEYRQILFTFSILRKLL